MQGRLSVDWELGLGLVLANSRGNGTVGLTMSDQIGRQEDFSGSGYTFSFLCEKSGY